MRFHDSVSTRRNAPDVLEELLAKVADTFDGVTPDLGFLFLTPHHADGCPELIASIRERTGVGALLGCTAESLVGAGREIEGGPAVALWLASLPGVGIRTAGLDAESTREGFAISGLPAALDDAAGPARAILLVGDPFSFPADVFLRNLEEDRPDVPVIGGMASGARGPGGNVLVHDAEVRRAGAVAAVLTGPVTVRTVVSQGCRPVGRPYVVTRCEDNVIHEMGGRKAMVVLREVFEGLSGDEQALFRGAPHLGCVIHEAQESFGRGDFLVRNLLWADPDSGAIAVGEMLRRGQTVQFHVRDAAAASEDLVALLDGERDRECEGGLLFTCNGRGSHLFEVPDHDVSSARSALGAIPLSGFFAAGEIGPIGGRSFMHGFTASLALFAPR